MFASQNFMVDVFYFDGKKGQLQNELGHDPDAQCMVYLPTITIGGGLKYVLFLPLLGEDSHFD